MNFQQCIFQENSLTKGSCIAVLGGGGKTTLLNKLATEFALVFDAVLQTSLTKTADNPSRKALSIRNFNKHKYNQNPMLVVGNKINNDKFEGITEKELKIILPQFDIALFECDGAKNRPLKAHNTIDPTVPDFTTHVIMVVGTDAIRKKVSDGVVHRPDLFCKIWGVNEDDILTTDLIAKVLTSKRGYLSKLKHDCKTIFFVNKSDISMKYSKILASKLLVKSGCPTYFGSIQNDQIEHI